MRKAMLVVIPLVLLLTSGLEAAFLEKLSLEVDYRYQTWDVKLDTGTLRVTQGDTTKEIPFTREDIDWENEISNFYAQADIFGVGIGYEIIRGLRANLGTGLTYIQTGVLHADNPETPANEGTPDLVYATDRGGFYARGGLSLLLPVYKSLFVSASPQVSYHRLRNMNTIDPDNDYLPTGITLMDYTVHQSAIAWRGDLLMGLDFGWISPYLGGRYQGFRYHTTDNETYVTMIGDTITQTVELYYKPSFWAAGIAGLSFKIAENLHLSLEGSFGEGWTVTSKLEIGL